MATSRKKVKAETPEPAKPTYIDDARITLGFKVQFPAKVKRIMEARLGREITLGNKIGYYETADGEILIRVVGAEGP